MSPLFSLGSARRCCLKRRNNKIPECRHEAARSGFVQPLLPLTCSGRLVFQELRQCLHSSAPWIKSNHSSQIYPQLTNKASTSEGPLAADGVCQPPDESWRRAAAFSIWPCTCCTTGCFLFVCFFWYLFAVWPHILMQTGFWIANNVTLGNFSEFLLLGVYQGSIMLTFSCLPVVQHTGCTAGPPDALNRIESNPIELKTN